MDDKLGTNNYSSDTLFDKTNANDSNLVLDTTEAIDEAVVMVSTDKQGSVVFIPTTADKTESKHEEVISVHAETENNIMDSSTTFEDAAESNNLGKVITIPSSVITEKHVLDIPTQSEENADIALEIVTMSTENTVNEGELQQVITLPSEIEANLGHVITIPTEGSFQVITMPTNNTTEEGELQEVIIPTETEGNIGDIITVPTKGSAQVITIPTKSSTTDIGQIITIPTSSTREDTRHIITIPPSGEVINVPTTCVTDLEGSTGEVITIPTEAMNGISYEGDLNPQVLSVLSQSNSEIQEEGVSPLSFVALVPDDNQYSTQKQYEGSQSYVALIPDTTHYAPPISTQEEDCTLTLKEITARERSRLIKRAQRQNKTFREKERAKGRMSMKDKRKDPQYREMERKKDRERRRLARLTNNESREKERERDREYRRRLKVQCTKPKTSDDTEPSNSLECFMKDMDEKCQLLINCKADESSNEEIIYNYNDTGDFDDGILGSAVIEQNERTDLIGQYGDSVLHSEMISEKDSDSRQAVIKNVFDTCSSEIT